MKRLLPFSLLLAALSCHAGMVTCSDGAGHQFMISQADQEHMDGLSCQSGRTHVTKPAVASAHTPAAPTPADMRIAPDVQKARDSDRRRILQDELQSEQSVLDGEVSQRDHATGEQRQNIDQQIHRTEQNIAALNRELARSQ